MATLYVLKTSLKKKENNIDCICLKQWKQVTDENFRIYFKKSSYSMYWHKCKILSPISTWLFFTMGLILPVFASPTLSLFWKFSLMFYFLLNQSKGKDITAKPVILIILKTLKNQDNQNLWGYNESLKAHKDLSLLTCCLWNDLLTSKITHLFHYSPHTLK